MTRRDPGGYALVVATRSAHIATIEPVDSIVSRLIGSVDPGDERGESASSVRARAIFLLSPASSPAAVAAVLSRGETCVKRTKNGAARYHCSTIKRRRSDEYLRPDACDERDATIGHWRRAIPLYLSGKRPEYSVARWRARAVSANLIHHCTQRVGNER